MNPRNRWSISRWLIVAICCSTMFIACDNDGEAGSATIFNTEFASPRPTFFQLRKLHENKAYLAMDKYIEHASADAVVDLLMAVDQLLVANDAAIDTLRKACPKANLSRFDLSELANRLGLFSTNIQIINTQTDDQKALLVVQVADRLPLEQLEFARSKGRWIYQPGQQLPELTPIIIRMAKGLDRLTEEMTGRSLNRDQVADLYRLHIGSELKEIRELGKASAGEK
jgi:hypothetical protein